MLDVSPDRFEELVGEALDGISDDLARLVHNVAVLVENEPGSQHVGTLEVRGTLLGLYQGVSLTRRGPLSCQGAIPGRITIFRGPHLSLARDERELGERVRRTVVHQVAHHFGISYHRLELGWG